MELASALDHSNVTCMQVYIRVFVWEYNGAGEATGCGSRVVLKAFVYVAFGGLGVLVGLGAGRCDRVVFLFFKEGLVQVDGDVDSLRS